jgi:hypothetical protein
MHRARGCWLLSSERASSGPGLESPCRESSCRATAPWRQRAVIHTAHSRRPRPRGAVDAIPIGKPPTIKTARTLNCPAGASHSARDGGPTLDGLAQHREPPQRRTPRYPGHFHPARCRSGSRRPARRCPARRCPARRCPARRCPARRCPARTLGSCRSARRGASDRWLGLHGLGCLPRRRSAGRGCFRGRFPARFRGRRRERAHLRAVPALTNATRRAAPQKRTHVLQRGRSGCHDQTS